MKVIFWGVGNIAREFIKRHEAFLRVVEVVGFTDSDQRKWKNCFEKWIVFPPNLILKQKYDYILILSSYYDEIRNILLKNYAVIPEKIISIDVADQIYVQNVHGTADGYKFASRSLFTEFAFTEKIYDKMLVDMDNMFSYYYLKEKYTYFIQRFWDEFYYGDWQFECRECMVKENTPIWICWLQGLENAPEIVKCCVNSIISNVEGKIHIITYDNYNKYVKIDECILKKHKCGIISKTHFSDIIRLALLCKYGGIWMDATLYMMDSRLPDYIYKLPFFMYKVKWTMDEGYLDPRLFASWFIKSERDNPVLNVLYKTIEQYWKMEEEFPYCLFHYLLRLIWENYAIEEKYKNRLNIYDDRCRILGRQMEKRYDELMWNMIKKEEPLQKLTYKAAWGGRETLFMHIFYQNLRVKSL